MFRFGKSKQKADKKAEAATHSKPAAAACKPKQQQQQQQQNDESTAVPTDELSLQSALLIQRWYRRRKARLEARRRASWMIYQSIEYSSEASQLQLQQFFNDMLSLADQKSGAFAEKLRRLEDEEEEEELLELTAFEHLHVEKNYRGPKPNFPITATDVQLLIDSFRDGQQLHAKFLLQLLHEARGLLKARPNICSLSTSISNRATVIGDLHGKLEDLLVIFYKNGLPSITNPYIFNGDFVDRGENSVETAAILMACCLAWPSAVFVNRGNHEDHVMNMRYGFVKEVQTKYKQFAGKLLRLFGDLFSWLPLATTIDDRIFVVHGGISDSTDLAIVQKLDRHDYLSPLRPPLSEKVNEAEWKQVLDLLWSDPKPQRGCRPNTFRGGGSYYGPNITEQFLRKNKFSMLVRSHECKQEGYEFEHNQQVLTIFSASNYYEDGSNKGAYARFGRAGRPQILQFSASRTAVMPLGRRLPSLEDGALKDLRAKIAAAKSDLLLEFQRLDPQGKGVVKLSGWCDVMTKILKLDLPWRTLRPHLVDLKDNDVLYSSTFQRVAVHQPSKEVTASVTETVYRNKEELETIFRIMDKDASGHVSLQEFQDACRLLAKATNRNLSDQEVDAMAKSLDLNNDGSIDFNEFLEAFRIVDNQQQ